MNVRELETISVRSLIIYSTSCQTLNLTQCAQMLGLPKSTISKEVTKLEKRLKTKLLERSTRNIYITEQGKIAFQHTLKLLDGLKSLQDDVRTMEEQVQGLIQISAPPVLGELLSEQVIPDFLKRWPKTSFRLNLSYNFEDLFSEGLDLAIRVGKVHDDRLISRKIGSSTRLFVASKDYLKAHGEPDTPTELANHNCLRFAFNHTDSEWHLTSENQTKLVNVSGNFFCASIPSLRKMTLQGVGISQLPISAIKNDLENGDLVRVLPQWTAPQNSIYAMYRSGLNKPKKLAVFLDYIEQNTQVFAL